MALQKVVSAQATLVGDGTSTSFVLDLEKDPYVLATGGQPEEPKNFFLDEPRANKPVGVFVSSGFGCTAVLAYPLVTFTYATAPSATSPTTLGFYLLF